MILAARTLLDRPQRPPLAMTKTLNARQLATYIQD
jgi:hypothetical protein